MTAQKDYRKGVGACIFNKDNKVLVAERLDLPGAWQLMQGGIDEGEQPQKALFREILEELGIKENQLEIIGQASHWLSYDFPHEAYAFNGQYKGQSQLWFALRFLGEDKDIDLNYSSHPEFSQIKWVELKELSSLAVDFKKHIYEAIIAEFKGLI